jgi:predicted RNA-binding Zn ribbon-like protein
MAELASRTAPGRLEVVRAFVNTCDLEAGTDALATSADLAENFVSWGLLPAGRTLAASDLRAAIELRESLRTLLRANNDQPVDTAPAVDVLNRVTAQAGLRPAMTYGGAVGYHVVRDGGLGALGALVAVVYASEMNGVWTRLKACAADGCHWAYYDSSRNRASRWCHMQVCGNRAKSQTFRARRGAGSPRSAGSAGQPLAVEDHDALALEAQPAT